MLYFKNVELAKKYGVAEGTVRNWIKLTRTNKINLTLHSEHGRDYVAKTPSNIPIIERLVRANRKYRNTLSLKTLVPKPKFYKIFSESQVYEIVRNLEAHHEILRYYNFFDSAADKWDKYTQDLLLDPAPSQLTSAIELLSDNWGYLEKRLAPYKRVNVLDVGVGNALPAREILRRLIEQKKLGRYIAIDISTRMLEIAGKHVKEWFGNSVHFEAHRLDVTHERFADLVLEDYFKSQHDSINLILLLGAVPINIRNPNLILDTICESMNTNDLLIYTDKLQVNVRQSRPEWFDYDFFDYDVNPRKLALSPRHRLLPTLLNIDESLYDLEVGIDEKSGQQYSRMRFKTAIALKFQLSAGERTITFNRGDHLIVWRAWEWDRASALTERFERSGFNVVHTSIDSNQYIMLIAQISHYTGSARG